MTDRDEAIRLARECGAGQSEGYAVPFHHFNPEALEAFYLAAKAKGAEEENEACAKACEELGRERHGEGRDDSEAFDCADHIRARKEKKC